MLHSPAQTSLSAGKSCSSTSSHPQQPHRHQPLPSPHPAVLPATPVRQSITGSDADDSVKHTSNTSRPLPVADPTEPALFCQRQARTTSHHFHPSTPLGILSRPSQPPSPASSPVHDVGGVQSLFQVPIAPSAHSLPRDKQHCQDLRTKTAPIQATSISPPTTSHIHHHGA